MHRTRRLALSFVVVSCLVAPLSKPARAQSNSYAHMLDTTRTLQKSFFDEMNRSNALTERARNATRQQPAAQTHLPIAITDFAQVDPGHPLLEQYLAGLPLAPPQRAQLRQALVQTWAAIESRTRPNNLATSLGVAVAASSLVLTGKDGGDAQLDDQILRINDVVGASPMWLGMSPRGKQQLSDSLMLTTSVMLVFARAGQTDAASRQASLAIARDLLQRLGVAPPRAP